MGSKRGISSFTSVLAPRRPRTARLPFCSSSLLFAPANNGRVGSLQIPHSRSSRSHRRCPFFLFSFATPISCSSSIIAACGAIARRRKAQAGRGIRQCRRDPREQTPGERSVALAGEQAAFWSPREHTVPWCVVYLRFYRSVVLVG
jgi:hypothetical protein